jgi:hypothetical protein
MWIAVIVATSPTGSHLLTKTLARGHGVHTSVGRSRDGPEACHRGRVNLHRRCQVCGTRRGCRQSRARPTVRANCRLVTRIVIYAMRAEGLRHPVVTTTRSLELVHPASATSGLSFTTSMQMGVRSESPVDESDLTGQSDVQHDWPMAAAKDAITPIPSRTPPPEGSFERADDAEAILDIVENETLIGRTVGINGPDRSTSPAVGAAAPSRGGAYQRSAKSSVEFR